MKCTKCGADFESDGPPGAEFADICLPFLADAADRTTWNDLEPLRPEASPRDDVRLLANVLNWVAVSAVIITVLWAWF